MQKLCFVVASPITAQAFLYPHIRVLQEAFDVSLVANMAGTTSMPDPSLRFNALSLGIQRNIQPIQDLRSLFHLCLLFRRQKFDFVHAITPKAGFLAMFAAKLTGVPVRIHWFTGQVWATRSGLKRWALKGIDRFTAALATHVLVDSPSQRDFLIAERVIHGTRSKVLAHGSVCGVDTDRFRPSWSVRLRIRDQLNITQDAIVLVFVGRLNNDKGIQDLANAFSALAGRHPRLWLLLVGQDEQNVLAKVSEICVNHMDRVRYCTHTDQPEQYMAASDIFSIPSYREGFGSAAIEAASCALPTVATRIYGLVDAIQDGVSGFLCAPGDVGSLTTYIERLCVNPHLRRDMGMQGRSRAIQLFGQETLTTALISFYVQITENHESHS